MDSVASSSSSSSSSLSFFNQTCPICSQFADGKHFGAFSCRACSAFFRRAIIGNFDRLKCKRLDGKCEMKDDGRFDCKKCRLQKCYDAGMSGDKLQLNRDLTSSTLNVLRKRKMITNIPHSPENFLGRPSFIFTCEPDLASSRRILIDVQYLIDHAYNLFISNTESRNDANLTGKSTLDRLSYALDLTSVPSKETPILFPKIGKHEYLMFWEYKFMETAKWLTYCDEFQQLPQKMKIEFLKAIWFVWIKVEKIAKVAEELMSCKEIDTICHVMNNVYVDMAKVKLDTSWMSNYKPEQLQYFLDQSCQIHESNIMDPLLSLRPSPQEITYMVCVVSFRYAAKQNPGPIADLSEKLIDKLANDLHYNYFNEWKLSNYASRMAQLMKIVQFVEQDIYERKRRAEIARLFDVFIFEFSHPEMFIGI